MVRQHRAGWGAKLLTLMLEPLRENSMSRFHGSENEHPEELRESWLVYDGECPFCSAYAKYLAVGKRLGSLHLVNARDGGPIVEEVRSRRLDLDQGMVLLIGSQSYHGAECVNMLAMLSEPPSLFGRVQRVVFRSAVLSRWLYPVLRAGRRIALYILGKHPIGLS